MMMRNIGELCNEIMRRSTLSQYSTEHVQRVGLTRKVRWDPNRPPTGAKWWSGDSPYIVATVPRRVSGKRVAIIDEELGTIDALAVGEYEWQGEVVSAVARPGSHIVKLKTDFSAIAMQQEKAPYAVNLAGKRVVGLTRGEMAELLGYAEIKESSPSMSPQNL